MRLLHIAARHGRLCLIAGLIAGFALPGLAQAMRPWLPHLVALLLFLTALRVGPRAAFGALGQVRAALGLVLVWQLLLPLLAVVLLAPFGGTATAFGLAAVLMLSAPSVTGAPNFAIMNGADPAPAMRLLVIGTAVFPLTVLPVLWLMPQLGGAAALGAVFRLILVILGAVGAGFALRHWLAPELRPDRQRALDGAAAIALAVIVVGLMSALGPLLREDPARLALWMGGVAALNLGLQIAALIALRGGHVWPRDWAVGASIIAGNRNIALFLVALPPALTDPLLIFIGCYQVPMYLTPIVMRRLHERWG